GGSDGVRYVGRWQGTQVRGEAVTADQPLIHPVGRNLHGRLTAFTDRFEAEDGAHHVNVLVSQTEPRYPAGYPYLRRCVACAGSASDGLQVVDVDLLGEVTVQYREQVARRLAVAGRSGARECPSVIGLVDLLCPADPLEPSLVRLVAAVGPPP